MKKFILLITLFIGIVSCEVECMYCGGYGCDLCRPRHVEQETHLRYGQDYFCAEKLLGTWQMDYGCIVDGYELKEIKFFDSNTCDIIMAKVRNVDWYTYTFHYSYYGDNIRFTRGGTTIIFKIDGYLFPELYLRDSFKKYTWRKVRAYGC